MTTCTDFGFVQNMKFVDLLLGFGFNIVVLLVGTNTGIERHAQHDDDCGSAPDACGRRNTRAPCAQSAHVVDDRCPDSQNGDLIPI